MLITKERRSRLRCGSVNRALLVVIAIIVAAFLSYVLLPPFTSSLLSESRAALSVGRFEIAIQKAQQFLAAHPESIEGWTLLARAGIRAHDSDLWKSALDRLTRLRTSEASALCIAVGSEEMKQFRAATAEMALRQAIAISPDLPEPWRLLAQLLAVQGRPRETAECLVQLIRLSDFTSGDLQTLAWPNSAFDDPARVDSLLKADPQNLTPMLGHVGTALNQNRTADAERLLNAIIQRHPKSSRAVAVQGLLLAERNAPEFLDWQRDLSANGQEEPETWIARGIWLQHHGQVSAAAKCFHQAITLDPRNLNAASDLGHTLQSLGESALGHEFLDWARLQQEITELSKRIQERDNPENLKGIIERLEQTGRIWEAWGWSRLYSHTSPQDSTAAEVEARLKARLAPDLPRTALASIPGQKFDWSKLKAPEWPVDSATSVSPAPAPQEINLTFTDDAGRLGIEFHFENGSPQKRTIVQTSGGGVAALDYDRDGWCDLYYTQGGKDPAAPSQLALDELFRNESGQGFKRVTVPAAVFEDRFSQGVASGDIDNDGFPDLYVANLGLNRLLRNNGDGTFSDITSEAGLKETGWSTSVAIADLNGDGSAELFSVRYAGGPEITTRECRDPDGHIGVCRPTLFPAEVDLVAVSSGDGRFQEVCSEAGLNLPDGRGFGLVVADFNGDDRLDVFIANDQTANFLMLQTEASSVPLRFVEQAVQSGVAFDRDGYPQACMGVAAADINDDGRPDLFITNFAEESATLYVSQPYGSYADLTRDAQLRDSSYHPLGFGTQFLDADLDGRFDLVVLNGHILDAPEIGKPAAMLPQLFRGLPQLRFAEVLTADPASFFSQRRIGRGLCSLDWNRDGLPDFAGSFLDKNAVLGTNRSFPAGHCVSIEFVGVASSRDAIGTRVELSLADGSKRRWQLMAGDGFAASNQRGLHLGIGALTQIESLDVRWPSGQTQLFKDVQAGHNWIAVEGRPRLYSTGRHHQPNDKSGEVSEAN